MTPPAIVCTGFHRSATSLVAQLLHVGGLNMGTRLVLPHRSNPDGHFEDADLVSLHDAVLHEQGTSLNLMDDVPLLETGALRQRVAHYLGTRDAHSPAGWGVKDPRLCLFLPFWARALGERGRFLLVTRHWAASLQSMLKRHSRLLADHHSVSPAQMVALQKDHLVYWQSGQLPRMWLAYAERMLQFVQQHHAAHCLVLPHAAVLGGAPLHQLLAERWGMELAAPSLPVVKPHLIHDAVDARLQNLVAPALRQRLDAVWAQLVAHTSAECSPWLASDWAAPNWKTSTDEPGCTQALALAQQRWRSAPKLGGWAHSRTALPEPDTWGNTQALLSNLQDAAFEPAALPAAVKWLAQNDADNGAAWRELGRKALALNALDLAEGALWRASSAGPAPAEVWALLAQVHLQRGEPARALHYWREATRRNPKSGPFAAGLVRALAACGQLNEAHQALDAMADMPPDWPVVLAWCTLMQEMGRTPEALSRLEALAHTLPERAEQWTQLRARLLMALDTDEALRLQDAAIQRNLQQADLGLLLATWLEPLNGQAEAMDLLNRLLAHWRDVLGSDALAARLEALGKTPDALR